MNRIRLLSENLSNQIAAGEVVERPASVVKELVENALDARARNLTIEIQAGGRSLIRITDDGVGMSRDDALLCLERHATSKIKTVDDLQAISTMGFRGEALPSIASVSRMTLTTREGEGGSPEGTQVIIHGGKIVEVKSAGCAPGTCIEVRQLFFNMPARKKFLRSEDTERTHIQHYLTLAALSSPEVGFTFRQDDRVYWQWPPCKIETTATPGLSGVRERMRFLHGAELELIPVEFSGSLEAPPPTEEEPNPEPTTFRVWGFIGAPGVSRSTRQDQNLFINRRPVENRGLNFALIEGYHTAMMKGRFPVCCLFVEIDPREVDVNVHPSKREVKFRHEMAVRRLVTNAVRQTLLRYHTKTTPPLGAPLKPEPSIEQTQLGIEPPPATPDLPHLLPPPPSKPIAEWPKAVTPPAGAPYASASLPNKVIDATAVLPTADRAPAAIPLSPLPPTGAPLLDVPLRLVGVVGRLYVVFESDRGMVLMDQHAAHERVLFEQMLQRMEEGGTPSQRLLLPETVELSPRDAQFLVEQLPALTRLGLGLSEFGERTFLLDAVPPFVKTANARAFVLEVLDGLKAVGREINSMRLGEHMVAKTVCRHAVKANDALAEPELINLLNDLRHCTMPYTCPHGRPTLIEMNYRELEKKFGRSQ